MKKDLHNIDDYIKGSLKNYTEQPDDFVWNNMQDVLGNQEKAIIKYGYKKVAWALLFLGIGAFSAIYFTNSTKNNNTVIQNPKDNIGTQKTQKITIEEIKHNRENIEPNNTPTLAETRQINNSNNKKENAINGNKNNLVNNKAKPVQNLQPVVTNTVNSNKKQINKLTTTINAEKNKTMANIKLVANKPKKSKPPIIINYHEEPLNKNLLRRFNVDIQQNNAEYFVPKLANTVDVNFTKSPALKPIKISNSKISIYPYYALLLSKNNIKQGYNRDREDDHRRIKGNEENKHSFNKQFGVNVSGNIGKGFYWLTGLGITSYNNQLKPQTVYARQAPDGSTKFKVNCIEGTSYFHSKVVFANPNLGDSIKTNNANSKTSYAVLPINIMYKLHFNKMFIEANTGLQNFILLKSNLQTEFFNSTIKETITANKIEGLKQLYTAFNFDASIGYQLKPKLAIMLSANNAYALTPINKNTVAKTNQNNIGVRIGLKINL